MGIGCSPEFLDAVSLCVCEGCVDSGRGDWPLSSLVVRSIVVDGCSQVWERVSSSSKAFSPAARTRCNQFGGGVVDAKYFTAVNS